MSVFDGQQPSAGYSRTRPHGNLRALRIAVLVMFGLLVLRLGNMQLVKGAEYAERARENHIQTQQLLPARGLIYDRSGEPLVENVGVYTATIVPEFLPNLEVSGGEEKRRAIYLHLEDMLGVPALETQARVAQAEAEGNEDQPLALKKHLSHEEALMLAEAEHDMPGVRLTVDSGRLYIAGDSFGGILGYVGPQTAEEWARYRYEGYAFNQPVGKTGVESRYERELRGQAGQSANEIDAEGGIVNVLDTEDPVPGNSVGLAIDAGLQRFTEDLLADSMQRSTKAAAVVMDAQTGEIYALVSVPGYDNNIFGNLEERGDEYEALIEDPRRPLLNQALNPAAPGSTFKPITAAAALQEGTITPGTTRTITSTVKEFVGENGVIYPYYDWAGAVRGTLNLYDALALSSNLYMFQISCGFPDEGIKGLGDDIYDSAYKLSYYARAFGLGKQTGIDIGNDAAGVIPNPDWKAEVHAADNPEDREWYHSDTCFTAVGQGDVLATPLQIARMTAAVANGGKLLKPRVVSRILSPEGETLKTFEPEWETVPVDGEYLRDVRIGMHNSVLDGAGSNAAQPGIDIAGKTGTAEFYLPDGTLDQHAWFTGFYPYDNPRIVVTVYFDLGWGGDQAAPVAGRIMRYFEENIGVASLETP